MKTFSIGVMLVLGSLALGQLFVAQAPERTLEEFQIPAEVQFVPGEVIVKMKPTMGLETAELSQLGIKSVGEMTSGGEIIYQIQPLTITALSAAQARDRTLAFVREFNARPDVEYAQPNYIERTFDTTPNDPRYPEQWHYFNNGTGTGESPGGINLPRAWDTSTGDPNVVVAVLDTGILPNHEDISQNLIQGFDMISNIIISNDGDGRDNNPTDPGDGFNANECVPLGSPPHPARPNSWHGTHVAGTIGVGQTNNGVGIAGVNWSVSVEPVRVLGKCGGTSADINDGIRWAAGLPVPGVPNNTAPAKVINMSLGTPPGVPCSLSPSRQAAINDAVTAGAVVVVAAGNSAVDAAQVSPASCNNVITVAASDYRGRLVTWYSNFGTTIEIMAPGGDRQRDDNGDGNPDGVLSMCGPPTPGSSCASGKYAYYNGTSMAAPHVAGVAALWLAQDPTLGPAQLLTELQNNALPRTSSQCPKPCGAGLLNAAKGGGLTVSLVLDPNVRLGRGETTTAIATVRMDGVLQANKAVKFSTGNTSSARVVLPDTDVTDANGEARATVRGERRWPATTTVAAEVEGVRATVPVRVPDLSLIGLVFLVVCVVLFGLLRRRPACSQT
jgi:serine protease